MCIEVTNEMEDSNSDVSLSDIIGGGKYKCIHDNTQLMEGSA